MSNTPKKVVGSQAVNKLREAIENEAKWMYYLTTEGIRNGLNDDFAKEAMNELGHHYGERDFAGCDTPEKLCEKLMSRAVKEGREAEAEVAGDSLNVTIGYCPMLNMWNQLTEDEEEKKMMCGVACEMYNGLAESLGFNFTKDAAIANGACHCSFCFRKK